MSDSITFFLEHHPLTQERKTKDRPRCAQQEWDSVDLDQSRWKEHFQVLLNLSLDDGRSTLSELSVRGLQRSLDQLECVVAG